MDQVFNALAHPFRRALLDSLRERDGQTSGELEAGQPMTRFGVMKHLRILEEAQLVVTRKVGRHKLHYLNAVPLQEIANRWIAAYAAPLLATMTDIAYRAEKGTASIADTGPRHVWEIFIRADAEAVWAILSDDEKTPLWQHFNMPTRTEWRVGGSITFFMGDHPVIVGKMLEIDPPRRLVHTFDARWSPDVAGDPPSRVTWEIAPVAPGACKLTLVHDDFGSDNATSRAVSGGWNEALSRLKTLAETGTPFLLPEPAHAG
jgi:uncharacterized protein YndB with AHSA1/START domain/DNA-binding transcriptional ArsR family regulator